MKRMLGIAAGLFVCAALVVPLGAMAGQEFPPRISTAELNAKLGATYLVILDVRSFGDWEASDTKIKGAVREDPEAVQSWAGKYSQKKTLVLYCA
jgi:hypothetical protein